LIATDRHDPHISLPDETRRGTEVELRRQEVKKGTVVFEERVTSWCRASVLFKACMGLHLSGFLIKLFSSYYVADPSLDRYSP
jgi:hypothetical protein